MAYQIENMAGFVEVRVSGETSKGEILAAIGDLHLNDREKAVPDLWIVAQESQVAFIYFSEIAQTVQRLLPRGTVRSRSALVAAGAFQHAQFELYRAEASFLPFEIGIFHSRDEAIEWLGIPQETT